MSRIKKTRTSNDTFSNENHKHKNVLWCGRVHASHLSSLWNCKTNFLDKTPDRSLLEKLRVYAFGATVDVPTYLKSLANKRCHNKRKLLIGLIIDVNLRCCLDWSCNYVMIMYSTTQRNNEPIRLGVRQTPRATRTHGVGNQHGNCVIVVRCDADICTNHTILKSVCTYVC